MPVSGYRLHGKPPRWYLICVIHRREYKGKAAGIFLPGLSELQLAVELGFKFVAVDTDGGIVTAGMKGNITAMNKYRHQ